MVRENYRSPGGYLFVTLRNLMGDALRQRRRRKTLSYGEVPDSGKDDVYFTSLRDILPSALDEKDRENLIAYYEEEAGYEELAERLDISVERCRVRVFRAKNRYRKLIEGKKIPRRRKQKPPLRQLRI